MLRTITNEMRLVRSVVAGVRRWADMMAASFLRRATHHLKEGEELPVESLSLLQKVVARMMESERDRLTAAETAYRETLRTEKRTRDRRDVESGTLYQKLLKARKTFEALAKGASNRYLGLPPSFGTSDPQVLLRHAHESVDILSNPDARLPDIVDLSGETLQPQEHVDEIRPIMEKLELTMDELELQKRETEYALKVKTQALDSHRETFTYGSRLNEALYVLAGEKFHSARLRPRVGRGGTAEPVPFAGGDDPVEGEADAAQPDTETSTALDAPEGASIEARVDGESSSGESSSSVAGPPEDLAG